MEPFLSPIFRYMSGKMDCNCSMQKGGESRLTNSISDKDLESDLSFKRSSHSIEAENEYFHYTVIGSQRLYKRK